MKSGHSMLIEEEKPDNQLLRYLNNLLLVFAEKSILFAAHYAKNAGRDNLSGQDTIYSLQFLCHEFMNLSDLEDCVKQLIKNTDEEDSDEEDSDEEDSDEEDTDFFSRANNDDVICAKMNKYHDEWDSWNPTDDIEILLKRNVDKTIQDFI